MNKNNIKLYLLTLLFSSLSFSVNNPDEITVYFPRFEGATNLEANVSTVLSLQLAQTSRRRPWPENPEGHDFGPGVFKWSKEKLNDLSYSEMSNAAQSIDLLAQIVVAGKTTSYGDDVITEIVISIPAYQNSSEECDLNSEIKCDFRKKNIEKWKKKVGSYLLETDIPRRFFRISSIVLKPEIIKFYKTTSGLPIYKTIQRSVQIGETGESLRFIEFNKNLPGAPTKLQSKGIVGYVSLPDLSNEVSEFSDMVGGILQVFRGDWEKARNSFIRVIKNPKTRTPLKVDALLYLGLVQFKGGFDGYTEISEAAKLAPYDRSVVRYMIMAMLENNHKKSDIQGYINNQSYLFHKNDLWLKQVKSALYSM